MHTLTSLDYTIWVTVALFLLVPLSQKRIAEEHPVFYGFLLFELVRNVSLLAMYCGAGFTWLYFNTYWATAFLRDVLMLACLWEISAQRKNFFKSQVLTALTIALLTALSPVQSSNVIMFWLRNLERGAAFLLCAACVYVFFSGLSGNQASKIFVGQAIFSSNQIVCICSWAVLRSVGFEILTTLASIAFLCSLMAWGKVSEELQVTVAELETLAQTV